MDASWDTIDPLKPIEIWRTHLPCPGSISTGIDYDVVAGAKHFSIHVIQTVTFLSPNIGFDTFTAIDFGSRVTEPFTGITTR